MKLYGNLYHGTDTAFEEIDLSFGQRSGMEFGTGFYATPDFEVAQDYAKFYFIDPDVSEVYVYEYEFDVDNAKCELNFMEFENADTKWYHFIRANQHGEPTPDYDFVIGPLEDKRVWDLLKLVEDNLMSEDTAFDIINGIELPFQIAIKTESAKSFLTRSATIIIRREE